MQRTDSSNQQQAFVALAMISRELYLATNKAQDVSLIAKNARALAVRAGDKVLGFKAITDFIDDLATSTIQMAHDINIQALEVANIGADLQRREYALEQFEIVLQQKDIKYIDSCRLARDQLQAEVKRILKEQRRKINHLISNLTDIQQEIRSAGIIALNAKVESAKSHEYQSSLDVIADNILVATDQIKARIAQSQAIINTI